MININKKENKQKVGEKQDEKEKTVQELLEIIVEKHKLSNETLEELKNIINDINKNKSIDRLKLKKVNDFLNKIKNIKLEGEEILEQIPSNNLNNLYEKGNTQHITRVSNKINELYKLSISFRKSIQSYIDDYDKKTKKLSNELDTIHSNVKKIKKIKDLRNNDNVSSFLENYGFIKKTKEELEKKYSDAQALFIEIATKLEQYATADNINIINTYKTKATDIYNIYNEYLGKYTVLTEDNTKVLNFQKYIKEVLDIQAKINKLNDTIKNSLNNIKFEELLKEAKTIKEELEKIKLDNKINGILKGNIELNKYIELNNTNKENIENIIEIINKQKKDQEEKEQQYLQQLSIPPLLISPLPTSKIINDEILLLTEIRNKSSLIKNIKKEVTNEIIIIKNMRYIQDKQKQIDKLDISLNTASKHLNDMIQLKNQILDILKEGK